MIIIIIITRRLDFYSAIGVKLDAARGPSVVDTEEVQRAGQCCAGLPQGTRCDVSACPYICNTNQ